MSHQKNHDREGRAEEPRPLMTQTQAPLNTLRTEKRRMAFLDSLDWSSCCADARSQTTRPLSA
jgi:hypothetical protein